MYYFAYKVGALAMGMTTFDFDQFAELFSIEKALELGTPLLLGCFILMNIGGVLGYFAIQYLWRKSVLHQVELRKFRDAELNTAIMARESYSTYKKFLEHRYKNRKEGKE